ncbi:MAG: MFS transporter [Spirochaetes bacterium]|nr:MFS transporter [Spirochaetota bacterium]
MRHATKGEAAAPAVAQPVDSGHSVTTIVAIMISVFLMGSGMGLQGSAVALRAGLEGFSDSVVGLIMSSNYIGLIIGSMIAPAIIRNVGYVRSFAASASLGAASAIAHLLWIDPIPWLVFRAATGLSLSIMFVVAESWLNSSSSSYNRGRLLSVYSVVYIVSMGAGQPLMGIFPPASFEIFGLTTILISFCLMPVALMRVTGEPSPDREPPRLVRTFMKSPLAGSGIIVAGMMTGATWSLTPLYGQQVGMAGGAIGVLMLLVSLGSMAFQWPLGWISDKKSRRYAILWSIASAAILAALIAVFRPAGGMLYVLVFLFGGFGMPLYSLSVALANDQFEPHEMVRAAGAIVIYYGVGSVFGPVLASQFMRWVGPEGLFLFMTAVLVLLLAFVLVRMTLIPVLPKRDSRYRVYPRTTASAFQLLRKVRSRRKSPSS